MFHNLLLMKEEGVFRSLLIQAVGAKVAACRSQGKPAKTQSDLAADIGVTRATISALEAGNQGVSLVTLCRIASALGVAPAALLPGNDELAELLHAAKARADKISPDDIVNRFVEEGEHG